MPLSQLNQKGQSSFSYSLKGTSDGTWHGRGGMERQTGNFQVSALNDSRVTEEAGLEDSDVSEPVTGFKLS